MCNCALWAPPETARLTWTPFCVPEQRHQQHLKVAWQKWLNLKMTWCLIEFVMQLLFPETFSPSPRWFWRAGNPGNYLLLVQPQLHTELYYPSTLRHGENNSCSSVMRNQPTVWLIVMQFRDTVQSVTDTLLPSVKLGLVYEPQAKHYSL